MREVTHALCDFSKKFDGVELTPESLLVTAEEFNEANKAVSSDFLTTITLARTNIRRFHAYQRRSSYIHDDETVSAYRREFYRLRVRRILPSR